MSSKHREARVEGEKKLGEVVGDEKTPLKAAEECEITSNTSNAEIPAEKEAAGGTVPRETALEAELIALRAELSEVNDKYLRKLADDINFRKRMTREREEGQRYALSALLSDMVPILDDFDRAIASAETSKNYSVLHDGIQLIRRQIGQMLENKYGLARFESKGQLFDPNRHEAVATVQAEPGDGCEEPVVAEELFPGYSLHDRILRTAKVRVRMPAPKAAGPETPTADAGSGEPTAPTEG